MPLFRYKCPKCDKIVKKIITYEESKGEFTCPDDSSVLARDAIPPSTIVKEVIDNGIMTKKVEQIANAPEYIQEREQYIRDLKNKKDL